MSIEQEQGTVVPFEPEELRRLKAAAEDLANMAEAERAYWMPKRAEEIGVSEKNLRNQVRVVQMDRSNRIQAERLKQERELKQQQQARVAEQRELDRKSKEQQAAKKEEDKRKEAAEKQAKQEQEKAEREQRKAAEREQREVEKAAKEKAKDKLKALGTIAQLPTARHEAELIKLAERLGEDIAALGDELKEFIGIGIETTEPWPEPVDIAAVLKELSTKVNRYVVTPEHQLTTAVLWTAHAWTYDHGVPTHSPILAATSAEPDSGKTMLVAVVGRACPRFSHNVEMTGPSLYRYVDAVKPTLVIDEADDLFVRKSDLKHIINAGWTLGAKIPRQVKIAGVWRTVQFDPFAPKAIALLGRNLPPATRTRCIELRMLPKKLGEEVEPFDQLDDAEFAVIRRKLSRWVADNAAALKAAQPATPAGFNNRAAANWRLLLAIAELAGGAWPKRGQEAAQQLTRARHRPSDGVQLLAAIQGMEKLFTGVGKVLASRTLEEELHKDPTSLWVAYNHGGPITQRQIAHLLEAYEIFPGTVHPPGMKDPRGYKWSQFTDAFSRYLPNDPPVHPRLVKKKAKKAKKAKKR